MASKSPYRLLVALDQSRQAENALRYLASLPLAGRAEVTLFHVHRNLQAAINHIGMSPGLHKKLESERVEAWTRQEDQSLNKLRETSRRILLEAGYPEKDVEFKSQEVEVGFARDIIAEAAKGYEAVLVGRSGLSKLKDAVMGSIASKLVTRLVRVPVWVIGGKPQGGKIMIAMDSSEGAMKCVEHVARVLGPGPQKVLLFHVIRSLEYGGQYTKGFISDDLESRLNEEGTKAIEPVFKKATQLLSQAGLPLSSIETMLVTGVPSRAGSIADHAKQQGYDTIVVGRRGISKVEEFFIGRVGNKVLSFAKKQAVWVIS